MNKRSTFVALLYRESVVVRFRQVSISPGITGYDLADERQDIFCIERISLFYRKLRRAGEFEDQQHTARFEYPVYLGKALGKVLEVPHPEGNSYQVEGVMIERKALAIGLLKEYFISETLFSGFFPADIHHLFGQVDRIDPIGMQVPGHHDSLVSGAGSDIQDAFSAGFFGDMHHFFPPEDVYPERQEMVQEIVMSGYFVEHFAYLLGLALGRVLVRLDACCHESVCVF